MTTTITKTVYELLRFVATWLQQPTVIQVADAIEVKGQVNERRS